MFSIASALFCVSGGDAVQIGFASQALSSRSAGYPHLPPCSRNTIGVRVEASTEAKTIRKQGESSSLPGSGRFPRGLMSR